MKFARYMYNIWSRGAKVNMLGVPLNGVEDSGADNTIMGGDLFKGVATVAKL